MPTEFKIEIVKAIAAVTVAALSAFGGYSIAESRNKPAESENIIAEPMIGISILKINNSELSSIECTEKLRQDFILSGYSLVTYTSGSLKIKKQDIYFALFCRPEDKRLIYAGVGKDKVKFSNAMMIIKNELKSKDYLGAR